MTKPLNTTNIWQPTTFYSLGTLPANTELSGKELDEAHPDAQVQPSRFELVESRGPSPRDSLPSLVHLNPRENRFLHGLLVDTKSSGLVLGVTTYVSAGHRGINKVIKEHFGDRGTQLWGGEWLLRNTSDRAAPGRIDDLNITSGMMFDAGIGSHASALMFALNGRSPVAVHSRIDPESIVFDETHAHLHPALVGTEVSFMNHKIHTKFCILGMALRHGINTNNVETCYQDMCDNMEATIDYLVKVCFVLLDCAPNSGIDIALFKSLLEKARRKEKLTLDEYKQLRQFRVDIQDYTMGTRDGELPNRYDLFKLETGFEKWVRRAMQSVGPRFVNFPVL